MGFSHGFVNGKKCKECKGTTFHYAGCATFFNEVWKGNVHGIELKLMVLKKLEKIIRDLENSQGHTLPEIYELKDLLGEVKKD